MKISIMSFLVIIFIASSIDAGAGSKKAHPGEGNANNPFSQLWEAVGDEQTKNEEQQQQLDSMVDQIVSQQGIIDLQQIQINDQQDQINDQQDQIDDLKDRIEYLENFVPRFTHMGDGTIRDNYTGLIWLKDASCSELPGLDSEYGNHEKAMAAAAALAGGTCGLTDGSIAGDWQLPTYEQWVAFVSTDYSNPAMVNTAGDRQWSENDPFAGVRHSFYWASNRSGLGDEDFFSTMDMGNYDGQSQTWAHMSQEWSIWPVRNNQ
jgi:Protein of unknown function (DUF1566)